MAIVNLKKSEREKMLASVNAQLKLGEQRIRMMMEVLGSKQDMNMTRIYSAFIKSENFTDGK